MNKLKSSEWMLPIAIIIYFVGAFFMPKQNEEASKYANREVYEYYDSDGEEHDALSLIHIDGVGKVYTYADVYKFSIPLVLISTVLSIFFFGSSKYEIECIIMSNCVLGVLLLRLTSSESILSTLLFWLGIIVAKISLKNKKEE